MGRGGLCLGLACAVAAVSNLVPIGTPTAHACGGLFCNSSQPVNQAAERIVFVDNGDGTTTAVIEIQYNGPSERFSWMLPVPGVPDVGVSSTLALSRLQSLTNPQFSLQTVFEDGCGFRSGLSAGAPQASNDSARPEEGSGVNVLAKGTVGPFDYTVIMVDPNAAMPAQTAIDWLKDEGFDIPLETPEVLDPYLANGLNLIAFRLTKSGGMISGSIRPVVITYESDMPFIPIRPTAVAANPDMGIMVFVASAARAVPANYKALELNEARIDWFNPMGTYDAVVTEAADEAMGQGFVTEFAGKSELVRDQLLDPGAAQEWTRISTLTDETPASLVNEAKQAFGGWDGFNDALAKALTLPPEIAVSDFFNCPNCYVNDARVTFDATKFLRALYEDVYRPVADLQKLLLSRPYLTRLYTTMSADEMSMDPAFDFNADLPDVSNVHVAQNVMDCDGKSRVVLPQGDSVYVSEPGIWPNALTGTQPAARKIMQLAPRGKGLTVVDNAERITQLLVAADPDAKPAPGTMLPWAGGTVPKPASTGNGNDCHVALGTGGGARSAWLLGFALAAIAFRHRRRARARS